MSNSYLRDFYGRYIAALNARDFDVMDRFIHDEVTLNGKPPTREAILAVQRDEASAVPDLHWELTNLIIDGDRVGAQLVNTGRPTKTFVEMNGRSLLTSQSAGLNGRFWVSKPASERGCKLGWY
jgi:predicted ester cyclase